MSQTPVETDLQQPSTVRYRVVGLLTLAAAIAYVARNAVGVAESTIRSDLGLTLQQSGWFMGAFFWSYALLQVPSGSFAQHRGTRAALTLFAATWSIGALAIGLAPALGILIVAQLLMGSAQAGLFPAACYSISHWIPLTRRSLACGFLTTGMQVGAITASLLTGPLITWIGWRAVFFCYAVPGFAWAVVFFARFRNDPNRDETVNEIERRLIREGAVNCVTETGAEDSPPTPWGVIVRSPSVWFLCGQQMSRAAGYMFFASWFPTFLQETRGVSVEDSGYLQAVVFTGTLTGCISGGLLTDRIWRRTGSLRWSRSGVGATFCLGCSLLIFAAWFVDSTFLAVGLLALGALFSALCGPSAYSAAIDIGGAHVPQVFGLMNMSGNLAAAACPILVAELFEWTDDWKIVLLVFSGVYLVGAACWGMVDSRNRVS